MLMFLVLSFSVEESDYYLDNRNESKCRLFMGLVWNLTCSIFIENGLNMISQTWPSFHFCSVSQLSGIIFVEMTPNGRQLIE